MSPATAGAFSSIALIWSAKPLMESSRLWAACQPSLLFASKAGLRAGPTLPQSSPSSLSKLVLCKHGNWGALFFRAGYSRSEAYLSPEGLEMTRANGLFGEKHHVSLAVVLYAPLVFRLWKRTALCCSSLWIWGSLCEDALPCHDPWEAQEGHETESKGLINLPIAGW